MPAIATLEAIATLGTIEAEPIRSFSSLSGFDMLEV